MLNRKVVSNFCTLRAKATCCGLSVIALCTLLTGGCGSRPVVGSGLPPRVGMLKTPPQPPVLQSKPRVAIYSPYKLQTSNLNSNGCYILPKWELPILVNGQLPEFRLWSLWWSTNLTTWYPYAPDATKFNEICIDRTNQYQFFRLQDDGPRR